MILLTVLIGLMTLIGLVVYLFLSERRPKNFPPGPKGLPFLGNMELGDEPHKPIKDLAKQYGNVMGIKFGSYWTVVLNNADDIRAALQMPEMQGKVGYNELLGENYGSHNNGILTGHGQPWSDMRRFSLRTLREFGFGKKSMDSAIQQEIQELVDLFKKNGQEPIETHAIFSGSVLNVIWMLVAGQRFALDDPRLKDLLGLLNEFMSNLVTGINGFYFLFPWLVRLRQLCPFLFSKEDVNFREKLFVFLRKTIQDHRETMEVGNPRDYIDAYLEETLKAASDPNSNFRADDNDFNLIVLLMDFFIAGSDTTSTTLTWAFFLLALHPEIQEKLFNEIENVVGDRSVSLEDRLSLPYCEAVLAETLRISTIAPLGSPHATTQDVNFKGFNLPKDTTVYSNLYAVHFDENIWTDPDTFRPERFISQDDGKMTFVKHKSLIPFGVGKRVCLGETMARDQVYSFLTNLVKNFKITMPPDEPKHTLVGQPTGIVYPEPHKIILVDRNE